MPPPQYRTFVFWIAIVYAAVLALVLYPAFHEGFGARLSVWNCIPPTLGLIVVISALGQTKRRFIASAAFAIMTAIVTTFFVAVWFFTPLDSDGHSFTTALVFVFAPLWSTGIATIASAIAWFAVRATST
jgi:hypothetical protein